MKTDLCSLGRKEHTKTKMSAYGDSYERRRARQTELETLTAEEIEKRCMEVARRKEEIEDEEVELIRALAEARKREEQKRPDFLSPEDEITLRRSLTVVGQLLAGDDVLSGGFELVDEEPDEMDGGHYGDTKGLPFSLNVATGFCLDVSPGLGVRATLKTKNAKVRAIVREMITSTEYVRDSEKHQERTYWSIDWDSYSRIEVKNPMTSEEYYAKLDEEKRKP